MTTFKAIVTNQKTGVKKAYTLSKANWRKHWACMESDLVICWYPSGVAEPFDGLAFITSGNRWQIKAMTK